MSFFVMFIVNKIHIQMASFVIFSVSLEQNNYLEDWALAEDLLTTTCLSTSSMTVSRFDSAVAKTLALDLKAFKLLSASSARLSAASNSLWNFLTRIMFELEICSCSSNWRLYILIFSFNLSRDS